MSNINDEKINGVLKKSLEKISSLKQELALERAAKHEPIALIGGSCRLPGGVSSLDEFWTLLKDGKDVISKVPRNRWNTERFYDSTPFKTGHYNTDYGGFVDDVFGFDERFFGMSAAEAENLDPQQRLLLELSVHALEHAGISFKQISGAAAGIFVGIGSADYELLHLSAADTIDSQIGLGTNRAIAAGRLAHFLNVHGPVMQLDTSCSSSLLAIHLACQSLRSRECDIGLAAGVNLMLAPNGYIGFSQIGALSTSGKCHTFDQSADGYVRGEGGGVAVLKRLSDAIKDKDNIICVISGSAVNHDGRSNGLTAPNGSAQAALIKSALHNANKTAEDIQYIEAHGTGTSLGDPIEVNALGTIFKSAKSAENPLYIGAVKTNMGHLEAAAGISSFFKTALAIHHHYLPPSLHFESANPYINWQRYPLSVVSEGMAWPACTNKSAGVSGFGMSGTNVHCILSEYQSSEVAAQPDNTDGAVHPFILSAKCEGALQQLRADYIDVISRDSDSFADICASTVRANNHYKYRFATFAHSRESLLARLKEKASTAPSTLGKREIYIQLTEFHALADLQDVITAMQAQLPVYATHFNQVSALIASDLAQPLAWYVAQSELSPQVHQVLTACHFYALVRCLDDYGVTLKGVGGDSDLAHVLAAHFVGLLTIQEVIRSLLDEPASLAASNEILNNVFSFDKAQVEFVLLSEESLTSVDATVARPQTAMLQELQDATVLVVGMQNAMLSLPRSEQTETHYIAINEQINTLYTCLASLYEVGESIHFDAVLHSIPTNKVRLPLYPFQRTHFERHNPLREQVSPLTKAQSSADVLKNLLNDADLSDAAKASLPEIFSFLEGNSANDSESVVELLNYAWEQYIETEEQNATTVIDDVLLLGFDTLLPHLLSTKLNETHNTIRVTHIDLSSFVHPEMNSAALEQALQCWVEQVADKGQVIFIAPQGLEEVSVFSAISQQALILKACIKVLSANSHMRLKAITTGALCVDSDDTVNLSQGGMWSLLKSIDMECPSLHCSLLDINSVDVNDRELQTMTDFVLHGYGQERWVATRDNTLRVPRLVQVEEAVAVNPPVLRGKYLITGGRGSIALKLASFLAQQGASQLILACRDTRFSEQDSNVVESLRALGCKVLIQQCDFTDKNSVQQLFAETYREGRVDGVYHLAGVKGEIQHFSECHDDAVLATLNVKIQGTLYVGEQVQAYNIPQFVAFSSIAATWGASYQASYALANGFLESYCHYLNTVKINAQCLNWGPWLNTGMAASAHEQETLLQSGILPAPAEQMFAQMQQAMASEQTQFTITCMDWSKFLPLIELHGENRLFATISESVFGSHQQANSCSSSPLKETLLALPETSRRKEIVERVMEQLAATLNVASATISADDGFTDLGMNSLKAIEFKEGLEAIFHINIPVSASFDYPTANLLSNFLYDELFDIEHVTLADIEASAHSVSEGEEEPEWDDLNEAELESLLRNKLETLEVEL
ncbi:SDR family NAD(P)-dependent oxidoreductase [Pseudoalteromonas sp. J010]|uniref:type I polyketide synthase n=1 Tax=Pseudoalteromonas sp. J010 TaxID=998465 RepID=UPI000F65289C|nr:SDR family NAD(P)-dependent oxidoreductase [Pseudoalteromonas sp. J010]RRS10216.1 SDR family NAD(P)-dependent oxidoreductase [Pseudoalteromonas sp. J010]